MNKRATMFSIFGFVDKVNFDEAFDAYCNGAEIIFQVSGHALEDEEFPPIATVSKREVVLRGDKDWFRFPKFVNFLKENHGSELDFYVKQKHRRS